MSKYFNEKITMYILLLGSLIYFYLNVGALSILTVGTSILVFTGFALLLCGNSKILRYSLFLLYIGALILMLIDIVYFGYFNELVSIRQMSMTKYMGEVSNSIFEEIKPRYFLVFIGIPLFAKHLLFDKKNIVGEKLNKFITIKLRILIGLSVLGLMSLVIFNPFELTFIKQIQIQEFFVYHIRDFAYGDNGTLDTSHMKPMDVIANDSYSSVQNDAIVIDEVQLYEGIAKDKNLIVIQMESIQDFIIGRFYNGQELTPNMNALIAEDSFYFDHYYQQLGKGNTSDAEFVSNNSLYPTILGQSYSLYSDNDFYGLPLILKDQGYDTIALHGFQGEFWGREAAYKGQGFDDFISQEDLELDEIIGLGLSDGSFFKQILPIVKTYDESDTPFYSFIITLSSHHPYDLEDQYKALELEEIHEDTVFGNYLQSVNYVDKHLGLFLDELREEGTLDDAMVVLYGDHHGLTVNDHETRDLLSDFLGYEYDFDQMLNIPCIIHIENSGITETSNRVGGQIDLTPTLLNLMGIQKRKGIFFGQDLLNTDEGFVASVSYMLQGSFITDGIIFEMARDGIFKNSRAWNMDTKAPVALDLCRDYCNRALDELLKSQYVLQEDLVTSFIYEDEDEDEDVVIHNETKIQRSNRMDMIDSVEQLTPETIEVLIEYKAETEQKVIVRVNEDLSSLYALEKTHPKLEDMIIPQIVAFKDFVKVQYLGYENVILEINNSQNTTEEIMDFAIRNSLYAVAIPETEVQSELHMSLTDSGIYVYVYGIDDIEVAKNILDMDMTGLYNEPIKISDLLDKSLITE